MILIRRIATTSFLVATLALFACGDYPIFTEMATNRLRVVLKGTFESNSPEAWGAFPDSDDSIDDKLGVTLADPTTFMLDIAEMRLQGGGDSDKFAFYRQTYTFPIGTNDEPFFDGTGVDYDCDDPYSDYMYTSLLIYIRKMILNNAQAFRYDGAGTWTQVDEPDVIFNEETIPGFDFNQLQYITYWDSLRTNYDDILRIFPLAVEIPGGFVFDRNDEETVLEVRFVVKNFIKQFEYDYISEGSSYSVQYWGLSDWLRDVKADESVVGGNIIAVARAFVPGKTATITGSAAAGTYIVAIESTDTIDNYQIKVANNRNRPASCDTVKPPNIVSNTIEAMLDYYIQYEKYRSDLNAFIGTCLASDYLYGTQWDEYDSRVGSYSIPPLVTVAGALNTYSLTNVPVGKTYLVYSANNPAGTGNLPGDFTTQYSFVGSVTIPANGAGNIYGP